MRNKILPVKVLLSVNTSWNVINFRSNLIASLIETGHCVVVAVPDKNHAASIQDMGAEVRFIPLRRTSVSFFSDVRLLFKYIILMKTEKPDVYLPFTVKPNIYGSIAAYLTGVSTINNITGLGTSFLGRKWVRRLVKCMYRVSLRRSSRVFFQNFDDLKFFVSTNMVKAEISSVIPGSGVNLHLFRPRPENHQGPIKFLLIARMLKEKGINEYASALGLLKQRNVAVEGFLLGYIEEEHPSAVSRTSIGQWQADGLLVYLGASESVADEIGKVDCVVLPSYREGTPRALLEGAAMGKPLITTNVAGCREVVEHGVTGFLCEAGDSLDLAEKIQAMAYLGRSEIRLMGRRGRLKVEQQYDERIVIEEYRAAIREAVLKR